MGWFVVIALGALLFFRLLVVPRAALRSAVGFIANGVIRTKLHQPRTRVGARVGDFVVFRETAKDVPQGNVVLVARFRLRFVHPDTAGLARVFRAVCILTTPFFSGVPGFRIKLWMEDRAHARYLGLYEFTDAASAARYADYIARVIRVFAVPGSVTHEVIEGTDLATFIASPSAAIVAAREPAAHGAAHTAVHA